MRLHEALLPLLLCSSFACAGGASATAPATATVVPAEIVLRDDSGREGPLGERVLGAPVTALYFFAADCPVGKAHDARLRELAAAYEGRVAFAAVVSEAGANMAEEREEARRRGLNLPVLDDRGARLADALGVEYSTHVVVLDPKRNVLYSGAFDSDGTHLTTSPEPYLKNALEAALAGRAVGKPRTEALGCPLRKR